MTDVTKDDSVVDNQQADSNNVIQDLRAQNAAMQNKLNELLTETKKAKQRARDETEEKEKIQLEKARKEGDIEQLLKSSEKERNDLQGKFNELTSKISSEKVKLEALRISTDLADGSNVELLSEFVTKRLRYTDEGVKVVDGKGELAVTTIEELKKEFETNEKFKSLIRGSKATGGNAQGSGANKPGKPKQIDRTAFDGLSQSQRSQFFRDGGSVIDSN